LHCGPWHGRGKEDEEEKIKGRGADPLKIRLLVWYKCNVHTIPKTRKISRSISVTDGVEGVCVDPREMGAILEAGESGDLVRQEGKRANSWHQTVQDDRHYKIPQNTGDALATTPSHVYAQSMYHSELCINYHISNHNRNRVLLYYLFQENKSFGSKKPFAFILWCMRSCVEHNRGGSLLQGKFPGNSRKLGIISSDYWESVPLEDFLPYTLGNLLCFRDSALRLLVSRHNPNQGASEQGHTYEYIYLY
jgi:hypothetical protein